MEDDPYRLLLILGDGRKNMGKVKKQANEDQRKLAAERVRRYRERIKNDPLKYEAQKEKERLRWQQRKEDGKVASIEDLDERLQTRKRALWKNSSRKHYYSNKHIDKDASRQKKQGRCKVRKDRAKCYRTLCAKENEIQLLKKTAARYKKRCERASTEKKKNFKTVNPALKNLPAELKEKVVFGEAIRQQLIEASEECQTLEQKKSLSRIVGGKVMKRYKMLKLIQDVTTYKLIRSASKPSDSKTSYRTKAKEIKESVIDFFNSDEASRVSPDKKKFIKIGNEEMKIRYLNESLKELHNKYVNLEHVRSNKLDVSYSLFCKLRPKWVKELCVNDRDTCLCFTCENVKMLVSRLHAQKVIDQSSPKDVIKVMCCSEYNTNCLERRCQNCCDKMLHFNEFDYNKLVSRERWVDVTEKRKSKKDPHKILDCKITRKVSELCILGELVTDSEKIFSVYLQHVANINHQFQFCKAKKLSLTCNELYFHVDFSENYDGKYAEEVQSVHFGGSREQIGIHTGVMYGKDTKVCFASLSKSGRHDAPAIMAHMMPVLKKFATPSIKSLHFQSDSPTNQYRCRKTFYFMKNILPDEFPQLEEITWNFSEAGHGKGAPDGVGGVIKRTCDKLVAHGHDCNTFEKMITGLETIQGIDMFVIPESDIDLFEDKLPPKIPTFTGTLKVHQYTWSKLSESCLFMRRLSCSDCEAGNTCPHFGLGTWKVQKPVKDIPTAPSVPLPAPPTASKRKPPPPKKSASAASAKKTRCDKENNPPKDSIRRSSRRTKANINHQDFVTF